MFNNEKIDKLQTSLEEMVSLQRALLTKLQEQNTMLGSIAQYVRKQSGDVACFSVTR
jgi:hypothetical protein